MMRDQRDTAQKAYDEAATLLADARAAAQSKNEGVRLLRERLEEARRIREAIDQHALELERHRIAADLLVEFRSYQSQRAWPHLEQGASAILSAATDGRYADVGLSDDFRIMVLDRGERHDLSRFSGGEQDVTNLCLRLAIAEWVARERGAENNFVVLDEVFGSQDSERRQLLLSQLRALGNRFQQMLVITHLDDVADLCEHQIDVRLEEEGRSTAAVLS
jgi:DNA repair protein SbcC/Rad50